MMNCDQQVDLRGLDRDHPLKRATRRVATHWPLAYSKLMCLNWVWSEEVPYGATDGIYMWLNVDGVDDMFNEGQDTLQDGVGYVAFLLLHEALHALLNHGVRLSKFTRPEVANQAADYVINQIIWEHNFESLHDPRNPGRRTLFPVPEWALLDTTLSDGYNTEQLYQRLLKDHAPDRPEPPNQASPDDPPEHPDGDQPAGGDSGDDREEDPQGQPDGGTAGDGGGGDLDAGPPDPGSDSPAPDPRPGAGGVDTFAPVAGEGEDQVELETSLEEQNERLMFQDSVEQSACGSGGDTANRIASERKSSSPQDWVSYAQQFIETRCEDGWLAPYNHGVYVASGLCAPGREGKKVGDIIVVADSSGSINREAWDKFIELNQYILDEVEPNRLLLLSCSDKVKDHVILEVGETVPSSFRGGGGTSFKAAFDWVTEDPHHLCIDPLLLIYFTDGVCTDHKQMTEPEYPVLWLSYKKPKSHFPWGEFAAITLT